MRSMTVLVATFVAFAALGAFLPSASAQAAVTDTQLKMTLTPYDTPVRPLSDLAIIPGEIIYTYSSNGAALIATTVQLKVTEAPSWASVTISPATIPVPVAAGTPGAGTTQTSPAQKFAVLVSTTADAPAFTPANIKITATALPNGNLKGTSAEESTPVRADFFSIVDAVATTTIQTATPQSEVAFPVTVTNFGNANTKIFFDVVDKPANFQVVTPPPFTLESRQAGGKATAQTVNIMIQTPFRNGYLNEVGSVLVKMTSNYALDSKVKGDTTQVSTLTTTRGFYVPGFEPILAIGLLGAVALIVRARR